MITGVAVAAAVLVTPSEAQANDRPHQLEYDLRYDLPIIGGAAVLLFASEYFTVIKPQKCWWCDRDVGEGGPQETLNRIDAYARRRLRWSDASGPQFASNVTAFLLEPAIMTLDMVAMSAADNAVNALPVDYLIMTEAIAVGAVLNQATKVLIARERPFVHALDEKERAKTPVPSDNNVSFYSGHTAFSFTVATAAGTIGSLRGYQLRPLVWSTLMPLAALTGYLRIAADKHYFTDVVAGAVIGSAVGVLVPLLLHPRRGDELLSNGAESAPSTLTSSRSLRPLPQMVTLGGGF
jgi:membrane-associated phospholipid phosphatase